MRLLSGLVAAGILIGGQSAPPAPARDRPAPPPSKAASGTIAGRLVVLGSDPAKPIRRARVTLESPALPEPEITDTDVDGRFRFDRLPAGSYRVSAWKPGFVAMPFGATRHTDPAASIELAEAGRAAADFGLLPGAALEGRLVTAAGEPLQNLVVSATRLVNTPLGRRTRVIRQARTDDLGRYRIHSLPPGEYFVEAAPDPADTATRFVIPGERPVSYAQTYYPGTARLSEARPMVVSPGQEVLGLEIALTAVPVVHVRGFVLDSAGKVPSIVRLRMRSVGGIGPDPGGFLTGANNDFEFRSVPPGDYWLTAMATPGASGPPEFYAARLTLPADAAGRLAVTTSPPAVLNASVETPDGRPLPRDTRLTLDAIEAEFEMPAPRPGMPVAPTLLNPSGASVVHLFGPRLLRVRGLPPGWALRGVWLDDAEITDTVTDFRGGPAPRALRIALTPDTATLEGTLDAAGDSRATGRVVVFSTDERQWFPVSRFVRAVGANAGRFTVTGLLPGRYHVAASDRLDEDDWTNPDVLRALRGGAETIELKAGERRNLSLSGGSR